eukprot:scaffold7040_cov256-Pinguiococcus_pyrenoidosus.AAC.24
MSFSAGKEGFWGKDKAAPSQSTFQVAWAGASAEAKPEDALPTPKPVFGASSTSSLQSEGSEDTKKEEEDSAPVVLLPEVKPENGEEEEECQLELRAKLFRFVAVQAESDDKDSVTLVKSSAVAKASKDDSEGAKIAPDGENVGTNAAEVKPSGNASPAAAEKDGYAFWSSLCSHRHNPLCARG